MIAAEEKLVAIEQHHVATRVTGNRNRDQIAIDFKWLLAVNYGLDTATIGSVVRMHDSFAVERFGESRVIRDIVFVRKEHRSHAAHRFNLLHQLSSEPR